MAATASADDLRPVITDNVVLSNEGGRWSVSLDERAPRERVPAPGREPVAVPAR